MAKTITQLRVRVARANGASGVVTGLSLLGAGASRQYQRAALNSDGRIRRDLLENADLIPEARSGIAAVEGWRNEHLSF
jgi:hypothetical protein